MPEETESAFKRSGRLFAAVAVLHFLAERGRKLPSPDDYDTKDSPEKRIGRVASDPYADLLKARARGGEHGKAASAIFRSIPDLLKEGPVPHHTISVTESAEHKAGYAAQLAQYEKDFPVVHR